MRDIAMGFHVDMFKMRTIIAVISAVLMIIINASAGEAGNDTDTEPVGFVGSEACRDCHEKEYKSFITYAKKSSSFESIQRVKKGLTEDEIKKCYFCHTTGYGKPNGFISLEETPHLKNAGCEVCHGPGALHVRTERPEDIKMKLIMKDCEECHISERVKAFRYKPMIHGGAH